MTTIIQALAKQMKKVDGDIAGLRGEVKHLTNLTVELIESIKALISPVDLDALTEEEDVSSPLGGVSAAEAVKALQSTVGEDNLQYLRDKAKETQPTRDD